MRKDKLRNLDGIRSNNFWPVLAIGVTCATFLETIVGGKVSSLLNALVNGNIKNYNTQFEHFANRAPKDENNEYPHTRSYPWSRNMNPLSPDTG